MYNILAIGDIHWGVIDANEMYDHLYTFTHFIEMMNGAIDLIVICGDYFDYRLSLNSKAAILAIQWMHELVQIARDNQVQAIRVIKGTEDHDNNQLEAFRDLEEPDEFFRLFTKNTVEETLPKMKCLYCPDENINWKDYEQKYMENLMSGADIGFFHGSFDIVLPDIIVQESEETSAKSVIFNYKILAGLIKGPLISAHWHDPFDQEPLHYIGSFEAWAHGEHNHKGFAFINYDITDNSYIYERIENPMAKPYLTIKVDSRVMPNEQSYNDLIDDINQMKYERPDLMIRVLFTISDENPKTMDCIAAFKHVYINDRSIKVVIKDLVKKAIKDKKKKAVSEDSKKFAFIFDKGTPVSRIIQEFIHVNRGKEVPIDIVEKYVKKYLPE